MIWQRINRDSPERAFIAVKNTYSTASLTNGQAVSWDTTTADGVAVTKPAAGSGVAFAGIAAETIAYNGYGLVQVYGYHSAVRVRTATAGSPAGAAGVPLTMSGAVFALESMTTASTTTVKIPAGFLLAAQASWTTKAVAAFIKAL